jgi:hypothetical protein
MRISGQDNESSAQKFVYLSLKGILPWFIILDPFLIRVDIMGQGIFDYVAHL